MSAKYSDEYPADIVFDRSLRKSFAEPGTKIQAINKTIKAKRAVM